MALLHLKVTIGASATQAQAARKPCREIWIEADQNNSGDVFLGGSGVSSSAYGRRIPKSTATGTNPGAYIQLGPHSAGAIDLSELWFAGTQNDIVRILYTPY